MPAAVTPGVESANGLDGAYRRRPADPAVRGGKPCVRGTRITVYDVLEYLGGGMTEDQIPTSPSLARGGVRVRGYM
jgi:hypothetical protein